ncbi:hypothetical protein Tco_1508621 [Tanacetum coccineum]
MSTYLKHMGGYTYKQLMGKSFDEIKKLFDKEMKRVNTFVAMGSEVQESKEKKVKGSEETTKSSRKKMLGRKRAGKEQQQESLKKQKVEKEKESDEVDEAELKKLLVIKKDEDIAIDAIPLATKLPVIIDYKLLKEGMMIHYQLIRADGSSKRHSSMIRMLQGIDREDLEALWRIVKAKYGDTRPENEFERVLWGDLKVIFEPDKRSDVHNENYAKWFGINRVHSTFHVSNLKKCMADEPFAIPFDEIQIDDKLYFIEEPVEIMDCEVKRLNKSHIPIVKVLSMDVVLDLCDVYLPRPIFSDVTPPDTKSDGTPFGGVTNFLKLVDSLDLDGENRERTRQRLFQFSLRDQASNWLERLPAGSITTWEDLTTQSLSKAWTRFKDLLQKVPHHGIDLWLQLRDRNTKESWALLEDLALYDNESENDPRDFSKPVKEISLPQDVLSTSDRCLIKLENKVQRLMEDHLALTQPNPVNKVTTSCEICSGPYDTQYCMKDPEQAFVEYASSRTDEAGGKCNSYDEKAKVNEEEEKDNPENIHVNPSTLPNSSVVFITEKGDDGEAMFIELIRMNDDSSKGEPEEEGSTTTKGVGAEYFDIFPTRSELAYHKTDEVPYKMPHMIEQYNSLSDLEKEHRESVYLRNEEGKRKEVEYVMSKIFRFYKECLELGPEYVTGIDDEVTLYLMRRSLEVLRKFHWMILGGRFNQLSHVSSPLLSKPGEY